MSEIYVLEILRKMGLTLMFECHIEVRSLDIPFRVLSSAIFWIAVLTGSIVIRATEFEVFAGSFDVVIDHIDQNSATEQALLLEDLVDKIKFVANCLLLLFGELGLLSTLSTKTNSYAALVLEGCEDILEARKERLFFLLSIDH